MNVEKGERGNTIVATMGELENQEVLIWCFDRLSLKLRVDPLSQQKVVGFKLSGTSQLGEWLSSQGNSTWTSATDGSFLCPLKTFTNLCSAGDSLSLHDSLRVALFC